ncbi:MAG: aldehyde dehydrogenase family protein, partial [Vicinamibacterales bacterium]
MTDLARARVIFDRQGDARWRLAASLARDRVARLRRLKRAVVSARQDLRAALRADLGRAAAEADLTEIDTVVDEINFVARFLTGWMRPEPVAGHPLLRGRAEIRHHARGRVLVLAPWNYPVYLGLMPL